MADLGWLRFNLGYTKYFPLDGVKFYDQEAEGGLREREFLLSPGTQFSITNGDRDVGDLNVMFRVYAHPSGFAGWIGAGVSKLFSNKRNGIKVDKKELLEQHKQESGDAEWKEKGYIINARLGVSYSLDIDMDAGTRFDVDFTGYVGKGLFDRIGNGGQMTRGNIAPRTVSGDQYKPNADEFEVEDVPINQVGAEICFGMAFTKAHMRVQLCGGINGTDPDNTDRTKGTDILTSEDGEVNATGGAKIGVEF